MRIGKVQKHILLWAYRHQTGDFLSRMDCIRAYVEQDLRIRLPKSPIAGYLARNFADELYLALHKNGPTDRARRLETMTRAHFWTELETVRRLNLPIGFSDFELLWKLLGIESIESEVRKTSALQSLQRELRSRTVKKGDRVPSDVSQVGLFSRKFQPSFTKELTDAKIMANRIHSSCSRAFGLLDKQGFIDVGYHYPGRGYRLTDKGSDAAMQLDRAGHVR